MLRYASARCASNAALSASLAEWNAAAKRITYDLKDISIMRLNGLVQDFMMPRQVEQAWHRDIAVPVWCSLQCR